MAATAFRQWCSTARLRATGTRHRPELDMPPGCLAREVVQSPDNAEDLAKVLVRATSNAAGLSFFILGAKSLSPAVLQAVLDRPLVCPRLILAADLATLGKFCSPSLEGRVGLMLDSVDVDTPLSSLIWENLEAIRFDAAAVARGAQDLRTNCALEAMLSLARNIGLCTLGPSARLGDEMFPGDAIFDYVPYPASPDSKSLRPPNANVPAVGRRHEPTLKPAANI